MNKKRLSVVMAGAMLASSVAPVLAVQKNGETLNEKGANDAGWNNLVVKNTPSADDNVYTLNTTDEKTYEVNGSNRGELVRQLRNLLTSKVYSDVASNYVDGSKVDLDPSKSTKNPANCNFKNKSAYVIYVQNVKNGDIKTFDDPSENGAQGIKAMEDYINGLNENYVVRVIDRGSVLYKGNTYKLTQEESKAEEAKKFTAQDLKDLAAETDLENDFPAINSFELNKDGSLTVTTRTATDELNCKTLTIKVDDDKVDFTKPLNKDGGEIDGRTWESNWDDLAGFKAEMKTTTVKKGRIIDANLLATVKISNVDNKEVVKLSDLYDGLLLTDKGYELLNTLKEYKAADATGIGGVTIDSQYVGDAKTLKLGNVSEAAVVNSKNGVFTFDIVLETYAKGSNGNRDTLLNKHLITVSSNKKGQLELFQKWMANRKPQVEELVGANRFETAVKVAKENASIKDVARNGNIVLVNGESLVDGLAAAPLAASVWNKNYSQNAPMKEQRVAPILLTRTDSLPKETKDYIRELIGQQQVQHLDKVTVYLVGGEAVISNGLERELRDLGLRVVRAGGANREETSLAVANVMKKDAKANFDNAFVVGAEGESDAMSIASVAAEKKQPIIVESYKGLSEKAINELNGWKNDVNTPDVTIVGGYSVVSKETEKALESAKISVDRVHGKNRQDTNAEVISRYAHNNLHQVVVSKDGKGNNSQLIDALTATSLAVKHHAPIVLGTNSLSYAQTNAIEKRASRTGVYVYQVGGNSNKTVLRQLAERVGLAK